MQCCVLLYNEVPAFKFQVHVLLEHVTELSCLNIKNFFMSVPKNYQASCLPMILCEYIAVCLPTWQRPWQGSCLWLLNRRHILPAAFLLPRVTSWTAFTNLLCVPYAVFIAISLARPMAIPFSIDFLNLNLTSSVLKQRFQFSLLVHRANE